MNLGGSFPLWLGKWKMKSAHKNFFNSFPKSVSKLLLFTEDCFCSYRREAGARVLEEGDRSPVLWKVLIEK